MLRHQACSSRQAGAHVADSPWRTLLDDGPWPLSRPCSRATGSTLSNLTNLASRPRRVNCSSLAQQLKMGICRMRHALAKDAARAAHARTWQVVEQDI